LSKVKKFKKVTIKKKRVSVNAALHNARVKKSLRY